jgi:hypothetical protein
VLICIIPSVSAVSGNDLLMWPAYTLHEMMGPDIDEFSFQAVAALSLQGSRRPHGDDFRKLRRGLFDRGLICIGSVQVAGCTALCFLTSAAVRSLRRSHAGSRGHVTMSELVSCGFASAPFLLTSLYGSLLCPCRRGQAEDSGENHACERRR